MDEELRKRVIGDTIELINGFDKVINEHAEKHGGYFFEAVVIASEEVKQRALRNVVQEAVEKKITSMRLVDEMDKMIQDLGKQIKDVNGISEAVDDLGKKVKEMNEKLNAIPFYERKG